LFADKLNEAKRSLDLALEGLRKELDPESRSEAAEIVALSCRVIWLKESADPPKNLGQQIEKAVRELEEIYEETHPRLCPTLIILAEFYARGMGDLKRAQETYERILRIREFALRGKKDDLERATALEGLGTIAYHRDEKKEAQILLKDCLAIREKLLYSEHRDVIACKWSIARALTDSDPQNAIDLLEDTYLRRSKLFPDGHREIVLDLASLIHALLKRTPADWDRAGKLVDTVDAIARSLGRPKARENIYVLIARGETLLKTGNRAAARLLYKEAIESTTSQRFRAELEVLLAELLEDDNELADAASYMRDGVKAYEELLPESSEHLARLRFSLARILKKRRGGVDEEIKQLVEKARGTLVAGYQRIIRVKQELDEIER
jgi:tetratricopeptide (TPR) repeat protein